MERQDRLLVATVLGISALLLFIACTPAEESEGSEPTVTIPPALVSSPAPDNSSTQDDEMEVASLPSELMFVIGESNGTYWIEILTTDELPCGNYYLVADLVSEGINETVIEVEGIALEGEVCLESVERAGARLQLGALAGDTELRFRYEEEVDVYSLEASPGFLIIEAVRASFTHAEYPYWRRLPFLYFYNLVDKSPEDLPADVLLFYTTTAWNEGDGTALRAAAASIFDEVLALGAQPFAADGAEYGVLYPTPPLGTERNPMHIIRYFRYEGPFAAVEELLAAQDEIKLNVYTRDKSNVPTPAPRATPTAFTPTPAPTKTPLPPTPTATPTPSPGPVSIFPSKEIYQEGEQVVFTITNHLTQPIYYRYGGCEWPVPVYIGDNIDVTLRVRPLDPKPGVTALQPGEAVTCTWDGQVYQRPEWGPPDSFIREEELAPVPRGQYQLRLNYALNPGEVEALTRTSEQPPLAHSPVFTIFGPHLTVDISHETRVELEVEREAYSPGSPIPFRVTNRYDKSIYYTYGCARPVVFFMQPEAAPGERDAARLTLRVPDESPGATELKPGESHECVWDQRAWQDPTKKGFARFDAHDPALGAIQVPPGQYRFLLVYYFADPDTFSSEGEQLREQHRVITHPFAVTEAGGEPR